MPVAKDLTQLGKLVAARHGWPAAKAFKAYEMGDDDRVGLTACALDLLKIFPDVPNAAPSISAAFAVQLERAIQAPVQVVAGTLTIEAAPVFEARALSGEENPFLAGASGWKGHVWVMVGPYIADLSIFRTAYSRHGPPALSRHIDLVFGPGKGLYVEHWKRTRQRGLGYEPRYVLSETEVTTLMGAAFQAIKDRHSGRAV